MDYVKQAQEGPKLLFFSGGTALKKFSRQLKKYTYNSYHYITAFDSGGSSAVLRQHFDMPGIGDVRSRVIALANESTISSRDIYTLLSYRLSIDKSSAALHQELVSLSSGSHLLIASIQAPLKQYVMSTLKVFLEHKPESFDLAYACIGNLVMAGAYIANKGNIDQVIHDFSYWLDIRGNVRLIVEGQYHLYAQFDNGETLIGQHLITCKKTRPSNSNIQRIGLSSQADKLMPIRPEITVSMHDNICSSELICYPMGSFYSSLIASLLPKGVGAAICQSAAPKVYIPNLGVCSEQQGMGFKESIDTLLFYLRLDKPNASTEQLVNYVIVDTQSGLYPWSIDNEYLKELGITLIDLSLLTEDSAPFYDDDKLIHVLLGLCR